MPTYDYRCNACDHEFELFQSMSDKVKRTCPECGKKALERLIGTGAALLFKGSGFYETDYRSESYTKGQKADKPDTGSKSEAKADSKPKPDSKNDKKPAKKEAAKSKAASK